MLRWFIFMNMVQRTNLLCLWDSCFILLQWFELQLLLTEFIYKKKDLVL